jgi:hypothetical protein
MSLEHGNRDTLNTSDIIIATTSVDKGRRRASAVEYCVVAVEYADAEWWSALGGSRMADAWFVSSSKHATHAVS